MSWCWWNSALTRSIYLMLLLPAPDFNLQDFVRRDDNAPSFIHINVGSTFKDFLPDLFSNLFDSGCVFLGMPRFIERNQSFVIIGDVKSLGRVFSQNSYPERPGHNLNLSFLFGQNDILLCC